MSRAFEQRQHKPGAANPYGSTERLQPLHRHQVGAAPAGRPQRPRTRGSAGKGWPVSWEFLYNNDLPHL